MLVKISQNIKQKSLVIVIACLFFASNPGLTLAKSEYPKLANYFLPWSITDEDAKNLAKWDVLILDMENQVNNPEKIKKIRELNPKIIILAYISSQEIRDKCDSDKIKLRCSLISKMNDSYYLKDHTGKKLSFWKDSYLLNITDNASSKWNELLPQFIRETIYSSGLWDGIFFDNAWHEIAWLNNGTIDINNDGQVEDTNYINSQWKSGMLKILQKTRSTTDNTFLLVGNSADNTDINKELNGRMFETFPTPWQGNGKWEDSEKQYLKNLPSTNKEPHIYIINSNTNNTGSIYDYKKVRFGLASTLLGEGYFSFDFGDTAHAQTWWYDEYNINLGNEISTPKNILRDSEEVVPGLWRKDFENGIALVNSTNKDQVYIFNKEIFEKIKGVQDKVVNDGTKINYIKIAPKDGIILLKTTKDIVGNVFNNGNFFRIFDAKGNQVKNGFFGLRNDFVSDIKIMTFDINSDGKIETITDQNSSINIYNKYREKLSSFYPYTKNYKGKINFAISDIDNDSKNEIITGASSGGPHIRIFDIDGNLINQFFAYDKNLRNGTSVAIASQKYYSKKIITGAGTNSLPIVKIFDAKGNLLKEFLAYDKKFLGGVLVASGDINGDGTPEIITAPKANGGPHIKIFDIDGNLISQFFAYDEKFRGNIDLITNDINKDSIDEVLVGINKF